MSSLFSKWALVAKTTLLHFYTLHIGDIKGTRRNIEFNRSEMMWWSNSRRWFVAASWQRWFAAGVSSGTVLFVGIWLLTISLHGFPLGDSSFGQVSQNYLADIGGDITGAVLIANSPQLTISMSYMLFNGIFTCMLLTSEHLDYSLHRKSLRVSERRGTQRTTYWLHLPYRYSMPLMAVMALLHYLVSESIFVVAISLYDSQGNLAKAEDAADGAIAGDFMAGLVSIRSSS